MSQEAMRALILLAANAPLQLREVPKPIPGSDQVLVRTKASGVNPLDLKIRVGAAAHALQPLPALLADAGQLVRRLDGQQFDLAMADAAHAAAASGHNKGKRVVTVS